MTDLERLAAAALAQWRGEGRTGGGPMSVGLLFDQILPYRHARRLLGIDASEDYEALLLRLIAEEEGIATVVPADAAEMARTTIASKLPDLDVLQLLRAAELTLTPDAVRRLEGVLPMPPRAAMIESEREPGYEAEVIPLPTAQADATRVAPSTAPAGPPPEFLTAVQFMPPSGSCWSCSEALPAGRAVNFCPFCGADQRPPTCTSCGAGVERQWKHCPDCGTRLGA